MSLTTEPLAQRRFSRAFVTLFDLRFGFQPIRHEMFDSFGDAESWLKWANEIPAEHS